MEKYKSVPIKLSENPELIKRLESFNRNAIKLRGHWDKLKLRKHLGFSISQPADGRRIFSGDLPSETVLEGVYIRFRLFILNDEDTNFYRVLKLLSSSSDDSDLHKLCRLQKRIFLSDELFESTFSHLDKIYTSRDIINYWFYSYYFHDKEVERNNLEVFKSIVTEQGAKVCLWYAVFNASQRIFYLANLLRDTNEENPYIYVPI